MFNDCLIMAGGSGTRLWPASNSQKPKQFLPAGKDKSFFSMAVERALAVIEGRDGSVIVIAGKTHMPHVIASCAKLRAAEKKRLVLIPEPEAKNTAPAIACALAYAAFSGGERNMLVLTSDHIIRPLETFVRNAALASEEAARGNLVVFGIPPSRPETGYGYIETGRRLAQGVHAVAAFREKPDPETAKKFAASKRFFWNSGMFAFSTSFMAGRFRELAAGVFRPFEKLKAPEPRSYATIKGLRVLSAWAGLDAAYRAAKGISFDYAIAEKCGRTLMIRALFDWIDVGNWEEYAKLRSPAATSAAVATGGVGVYHAGSIEQSCFVDSDIPLALAGVEDLIVVIRSGKKGAPPVALITKKGETQRVRELVEAIKKAGRDDLL